DRDEDSDLILRSIAVATQRPQCVSKDGGRFGACRHPSRRPHISVCGLLKDEVWRWRSQKCAYLSASGARFHTSETCSKLPLCNAGGRVQMERPGGERLRA